jgi:inorganic pyrophosphatase
MDNDRLLGVAIHSYTHQHFESIKDISSSLLDQVEEFFVSYNKQRKKKFKIKALGGPKRALKFVKAGIHAYKKRSGGSP